MQYSCKLKCWRASGSSKIIFIHLLIYFFQNSLSMRGQHDHDELKGKCWDNACVRRRRFSLHSVLPGIKGLCRILHDIIQYVMVCVIVINYLYQGHFDVFGAKDNWKSSTVQYMHKSLYPIPLEMEKKKSMFTRSSLYPGCLLSQKQDLHVLGRRDEKSGLC